MSTLFGDKIISSISYSQDEILQSIIKLFAPGGIELDGTYGYGNFYKTIAAPAYRYDTKPKAPGVEVVDCRKMPLESGTIQTAIFDPPFVLTDHKESADYLMAQKYEGFRLISELRTMYRDSITEYHRVLKKGGILIVKCQDMSHGRDTQYFIHNEVLEMANEIGFKAVDLFIVISKNRFISNRSFAQKTARKFHAYFWVLRKRKRKL